MAYVLFSTREVFANEQANVICNIIMNELEKSGIASVSTKMALTGTPAKIMQGASSTECPVIPFITTSDDIYNYFAGAIANKLKGKIIKLRNRIQMDVNGIYVELWKTASLTIVEVDTIQLQDDAEIPSNIL